MIELICTRQTVLLLISFGLINLFEYRRKISTFLRRSLSERDWSLFVLSNTPFCFPLVFTLSNTPFYFHLYLHFCSGSFICHWFARFLPSCFFVSRMPTDSVSRKWQMPTRNGKCLHGHLPHYQNSQKFHFAALKRVILEMNNIHSRAD